MSKKCCNKKCRNNKCYCEKPVVDTLYTSFLRDSQQNSLYTHFLQGPTAQIVCKPSSLPEVTTGSMVITDPNRGVGYTQLVQASTQQYTGAPNPLQPYVRIGNNIIPSTDNLYDLGAATQRFRTGYFGSGGIDISGLVITISGDTLILPTQTRFANGASFGSGGGGGSSSSSDLGLEWINRNLIGKSPVPQIGSITVRSSEIYIPWTYPDQFHLTFMDAWVPGITALNASLEYIMQNVTRQTTVLQKAEGENYVDLTANRYTRLTSDSHVTGIVLTNTPGAPTYMPSVTFPDGSVRNVYRFYHPDFEALTTGTQMIMNLSYSNYGTPYDTARAVIDIFKTPSPPSAPRNIQQSLQQPYTIAVTYQAPEFTDISDALSTATITEYTITYSSSGSSKRYPTSLPTTQTAVTSATISRILSALTPDSTYAITITATNSAGLTGAAAITQLVTTTLTPPPLLSAIQFNLVSTIFNTNNYVIKRVSDGATLAIPLLLATATGFTLQAFQNGIHSIATRGDTGTGVAVVDISTNGKTARITYNGFPASTPPTVTQDGITIQSTGVADTYAAVDPATGSQGFYLTGTNSVNVNLAAAGIIPTFDPYIIMATASQGLLGGSTATSSLSFYYDDYPTAAPVFVAASVSRGSSSIGSVSGITLVGICDVNILVTLQHMGKYFYREPMLIATANLGLMNDAISIANVIAGKTATQLSSQINITKYSIPLQLNSTSTMYTNAVDIFLTANGPEKSTVYNGPKLSIPIMIDMLSYNLVYRGSAFYASTPPIFNTSTTGVQSAVGYRIESGKSRAVLGYTVNPYVTEFTDPVIPYNHDIDIINTEELQISQGKYRSRRGGGYEDYSTTELNRNRNYTSIPAVDYRFASFYWDISGFPNVNSVIGLIFRLQGLDYSFGRDSIGRATLNGKLIILYYRFVEDLTAPTPYSVNVMTSLWINGNNTALPVSSENYITHANNTETRDGLILIDNTSNPTECLFNVRLPRQIRSNCRVYCRVGLPMDEPASFRNISAIINVQ